MTSQRNYDKPYLWPLPKNDEEYGQCDSCPAEIYWVVTKTGKNLAINKDTRQPHFLDESCPRARKQ